MQVRQSLRLHVHIQCVIIIKEFSNDRQVESGSRPTGWIGKYRGYDYMHMIEHVMFMKTWHFFHLYMVSAMCIYQLNLSPVFQISLKLPKFLFSVVMLAPCCLVFNFVMLVVCWQKEVNNQNIAICFGFMQLSSSVRCWFVNWWEHAHLLLSTVTCI